MSQDDASSVLLPAAKVDFFTADEETAKTAEKITVDWRFARVGITVQRDGIDAAIAHYTQNPSPELIIIGTDDISEAFIEKLGHLAGACSEGTDAVIIGPTNDVHLYRNLVGMGVRDYLVRPVVEEDMVAFIAQAVIEKRGLTGARLVAVTGGKGGVGTTAIAQILAWNIAEPLGQKTLLMDVAGSNSTLGVAYGVEPTAGFAEVVRIGVSGSEDDMKRIMQNITEDLTVLVCGGDPILTARPDADAIEALINRILQKYPVVVIDMSGASRAVQKRVFSLATEIVVVTTPLLTSLRNARTLLNEIKSLRSSLNEVDLVVNMHGIAGKDEVPVKDIEAALGKVPAACLPYAPKIFAGSETTGVPVGRDKGAQDVLKELMNVSVRSAGAALKDGAGDNNSGKEGFFSLLKKKIVKT